MKTKTWLLSALLILPALLLCSCHDDKDEPIFSSQLPVAAQSFVATYYPASDVLFTMKDGKNYDVTMSNGHEIEFNKHGEWTDVDAPMGQTIPSGFYPEAINTFISTTVGGYGINEIKKVKGGYEVQLITGAELRFNSSGTFIRID